MFLVVNTVYITPSCQNWKFCNRKWATSTVYLSEKWRYSLNAPGLTLNFIFLFVFFGTDSCLLPLVVARAVTATLHFADQAAVSHKSPPATLPAHKAQVTPAAVPSFPPASSGKWWRSSFVTCTSCALTGLPWGHVCSYNMLVWAQGCLACNSYHPWFSL